MRFRPGDSVIGGRYGRAFVAALLVVNQFAVASGLPFPQTAFAIKKDLSKPFPCMNRPCGCQNADQCWHECCCFTMREKLAWAEANGVTPPDFVREAAAREALADGCGWSGKTSAGPEKKHCCCHCCKAAGSPDPKQACDRPNCDKQNCTAPSAAASPPPKPVQEPAQPGGKSIVLLMALACQGQSSFSLLAQALPFFRRPTLPFEPLRLGPISLRSEWFASHTEPPEIPPPEYSLAAYLGCS